MKLYELTYLISAELSEEELKALQEKINSFIQEEGILNRAEKEIKKKLAQPVEKKGVVSLVTLSFQMSPEKLINLEKKMKMEPRILRYFILAKKVPKFAEIKVPTLPKKPPRIPKKIVKPKVELKEIEKKLEEILGET